MNILKCLGSTVLLLFFITVSAQEKRIAQADEMVENYAYNDAIKVYEKLAKKGNRSPALFEKLGDAYYFKNEPDKAIRWYRELFYLKQEVPNIYYYRMAMALKSLGRYDQANEMLNEFSKRNGTDSRAGLYDKNKNYLEVIKNNSGRYKVKITDASSTVSDYGPAFYGDTIIFTSNRDSVGILNSRDKWTNRSFSVFYKAAIGKDGGLKKPQAFLSGIDSKFHVSTPAFTKDKKVMYFTRNNYNEGKVERDDNNRVLLKIYKAVLEGKKWQKIEELPFNSNSFNTAHPALSPDEKTLYFASDRPGTYGESDIYKVSINDDGTYGAPENLGPGINTEGKETFPFVTDDKLYFASNGHPGLGGLDIFVSKREENGLFLKVINVGEPVNTRWDDFALIIDETTKMGYFSSNRRSGRGYDDIYSLTELVEQRFTCEQSLSGTVADEATGDIFANSKISLLDENHVLVKEITTDAAGLYSFDVECGKSYFVKAEKENYFPKEIPVSIKAESGETNLSITQVAVPVVVPEKPLPPPAVKVSPEPKIKVGMDLAKEFHIEQIYFDVGKAIVKPDAEIQIQKVISFMKQYPTAKVDVRSHTDSRASDKYNETLSDNRAKAIMTYIIANGIAEDRVSGRGYGETRLLNKCEDGVKCTDEEHLKNRRSEFILVEL